MSNNRQLRGVLSISLNIQSKLLSYVLMLTNFVGLSADKDLQFPLKYEVYYKDVRDQI